MTDITQLAGVLDKEKKKKKKMIKKKNKFKETTPKTAQGRRQWLIEEK